MNIFDVIKTRSSVRTYQDQKLDKSQFDLIQIEIDNLKNLMNSCSLQLVGANANDSLELKGLGTYGTIKNPQAFVIGILHSNNSESLVELGEVLERLILKLHQHDLGTCWLGGSFTRSSFASRVLDPRMVSIPVVVSIGIAADKRSFVDRVLRYSAKSDQRIPFCELFFHNSFEKPLAEHKLSEICEMVRLAPSASNKQPWRVVIHDDMSVDLFLYRIPKYTKLLQKLKFADLPMIDMGIAKAHFELSSIEKNYTYQYLKRTITYSTPSDMSYVGSWELR